MALKLHIPPCIDDPAHHLHPPAPERPLRIQIEGPLVAIERLFPAIEWRVDVRFGEFPQPVAQKLANMAY
ncbi:hypothetical protein ACQKWADRAFT_300187 [Trichoderma austrokoningii]